MITLSVSKFTEENPFTEEKQKPYTEHFEKVEKTLLEEIDNLIEKTAEKHSISIIPLNKLSLVLIIDMSTVHL